MIQRRHFALLIWSAVAIAAGDIAIAPAHAEDGYRLGHGLDLGPFNFAGYGNLVLDAPQHGRTALVLDDLSLYVSGHVNRFINPFAETELTQFDITRSAAERSDGHVVLERLYNDAYLNDSFTFRAGKMLAPVGEWNEIHAAPLVLTTVRPAVTYRNFSEYATGVSVLYSDPYERYPDVAVYWQPVGELSERPSDITVHQYDTVEGAHVSLPFDLRDKVGASFQHSKDSNGIDQSLFGVDFHYSIDDFTFQGEASVSDIANPQSIHARDIEWGAYGAASYALDNQWSVYGWYEGFADRTATSPAQDVLFGVAFRPRPETVLRLEYLQNLDDNTVNPTGLFASFAILF